MDFKPLAWTLVCLGLSGPALAGAHGSVDFRLDPMTALSSGPGDPGGPATVGHWLRENSISASILASRGFSNNNDNTRWLELRNGDVAPDALRGQPFGEASIRLPEVGGRSISAEAIIDRNFLRVAQRADENNSIANASLNWQRPFELQPYASLTLSGVATLENSLSLVPVASYEEYTGVPWNSVNAAVIYYRPVESSDTGLNIIANILDRNPLQLDGEPQDRTPSPQDFSYTADADGRLSLTVHNTTGQVLYGQFEIMAYTWAAQVPEPAAALSMLCGLAVLGTVARRRKCVAGSARTRERRSRPTSGSSTQTGTALAPAAAN